MPTNFWTKRVVDFGHTGWADEAIYAFDQPIRIEIVDYLVKAEFCWILVVEMGSFQIMKRRDLIKLFCMTHVKKF